MIQSAANAALMMLGIMFVVKGLNTLIRTVGLVLAALAWAAVILQLSRFIKRMQQKRKQTQKPRQEENGQVTGLVLGTLNSRRNEMKLTEIKGGIIDLEDAVILCKQGKYAITIDNSSDVTIKNAHCYDTGGFNIKGKIKLTWMALKHIWTKEK